MDQELLDYYNSLVDEVSALIQVSTNIEARISGINGKIDHVNNYFLDEINSLKQLISDLDLFVQGLLDKLSVLSKASSSFVSREEYNLLKKEVNKLNFEGLALRKK